MIISKISRRRERARGCSGCDFWAENKDINKYKAKITFYGNYVKVSVPTDELVDKYQKSVAGFVRQKVADEDVVEELFGEIEDEHDKVILKEEQISDTEYVFSARLEIDYLNTEYKLDLEEDESYETLGGYLMSLLEDIPNEGEKIETEKYSFLIQKISKTRIEEVLLTEKNVKNEA